jgi:succinate dehydrogenase / fumarate reductase membrane anchor subunit
VRKAVTGLRAWMLQRASAVYMLTFIAFFLIHFFLDPPHSYVAWRGWMRSPGVSIATCVFFVALLVHAWVGVRDVVMDYVHPAALRVCVLAFMGFGLSAIGAWILRIFFAGNS